MNWKAIGIGFVSAGCGNIYTFIPISVAGALIADEPVHEVVASAVVSAILACVIIRPRIKKF